MLVTCPECGAKVSSEAYTCPCCGLSGVGDKAITRSKEFNEIRVH